MKNKGTMKNSKPDIVNAMHVTDISVTDIHIESPGRGMIHLERVDQSRTAGGIHIPDSVHKDRLARWRVLAVGPANVTQLGHEVPQQVEVGDEVFLAPQLGTIFDLPFAGKKEVLASDTCVIAKVRS
jgi:co-chaperonin GroES (HSP10)